MSDTLVLQKRKKTSQETAGRIMLNLTVVLIVVLWTIPTFGLLVSSFRDPQAINTSGWWNALFRPFTQGNWTFDNYIFVLTEDGMGNAFLNSLLVTIPATVIPITIAAFAAYGLAWMEFKGRRVMFILVVGLMVVPLQTSLLPLFRLYENA
ncbi:MAG: carbohydrate ABC transporter permease, partial [Spirochaetales bacterium]|nr:carbohydrate ABC transporter permease [Spirochaetales bacterium]